jgi:hypothetical protein
MKNSILIILSFALLLSCKTNEQDQKNDQSEGKQFYQNWKPFELGSVSFMYPPAWKLFLDTTANKIHLVKHNSTDTSMYSYDIAMAPSPKYYAASNSNFNEYVHGQLKNLEKLYEVKIDKEVNNPINSRNAFKFSSHYLTDAGNQEEASIVYIEGSFEDFFVFATGEQSSRSQADSIIQTIQMK